MSDSNVTKFGLESLVVLTALVVVPAAFGTGFTQFEYVKEALLCGFGGLALIAWGAGVLRGKVVKMPAGRLSAFVVAFAAFVAFSLLWAPAWQQGGIGASSLIAASGIFMVVAAPIGRPISFRAIAAAIAAGLVLTAALGLADFAGASFLTTVWDPPGAAGPFDAREFAVGYYAFALPIAIGGAFQTEGVTRPLCALGALLGAVHFGLVAEVEFIAMYAGAGVVAVVLLGLFQGFNRISLTFGSLGGIAVTAGIAFGLAFAGPDPGRANDATQLPWIEQMTPPPIAESAEIRDVQYAIPRIEEAPNWEARDYVVGVAFELFREEPIIGHGPGGWWDQQTRFPRQDEPFVEGIFKRYPAFRAPHNGFAWLMVEYGAVGLLLFGLWLAALAGITVTALARKEEPENWLIAHYTLVVSMIGGVAVLCFTPALQLASSVILLFAVAGLLTRESAALNDYEGMSKVWTINGDGRRLDTTFFCGVLPVVVGIATIGMGALWGVATYYESWGDLAMLRTKHELAIEKYDRAEEILGGDGELLINRALAKKRLGMTDKAVVDVNSAAKLREYDVRVLTLLASLQMRERKYADAASNAKRAVELFPNYIGAYRALAAALDLQGRMSDAANVLVDALAKDPPDDIRGQVHRDLAGYYAGPLDNPNKAVEHFEKALSLIEAKNIRDSINEELTKQKDEAERRRLRREGKPIPKELLPTKMPEGHEGHVH